MTDTVADITTALARSGLYRLLALSFRYPTPELRTEIARVQDQFCQVPWPFADIDPALLDLPAATVEDLQADYLHLFDMKVACSPYESEYGMGNKSFTKTRDLADIAGFYAAFGVSLGDEAGELFDHIQVELEFMSILALKEASACHDGHADGYAVTREGEASFLQDHLGRWVPTFCQRLAEAGIGPLSIRPWWRRRAR